MLESLHLMEPGGMSVTAYVATCCTSDPKSILHWLSDHLNAVTTIAGIMEVHLAALDINLEQRSPSSQFTQFEKMLALEGWKTFA